MRIRINQRTGARSKNLRAHVQRRLDFALSGFQQQIATVLVRFSRGDPTKMTNGAGMRCEIEVRLHARTLGVEDTDLDLAVAVDNATRRLRRSLAHAIENDPPPPAQPRRPPGRGRRPA